MLKNEKTLINGHDYQTTVFPAMYGWRLGLKIANILRCGLPELLKTLEKHGGGGVGGLLDANVDFGALGNAVSDVIGSIVEHDPNGDVIGQLLSQTTRDGMALNDENRINQCYSGNHAEMLKAVVWIMKVNFGGFTNLLADTGSPTASGQEPRGQKSRENLPLS
jgi:hypothetical protein